jgi:hypothetical protein
MSRLGERSLFVLILVCVAVFGVSAGAGAAGFVVTKTMWNSMTTRVNQRPTSTTLNTKIANLQKQIDEANGQIAALQAANPGTGDQGDAQAALDEHVNGLIAANKAVKQASEDAGLAIARLDSVETSITSLKTFNKNLHVRFSDKVENGLAGPHVYFEDVNVHILDTSFPWPKGDGQGNLIIGGNGVKPTYTRPTSINADTQPKIDWNVTSLPTPRTGSNTLVIGDAHAWEGYGGIVSGYGNTLLGDVSGNAVIGGAFNSTAGGNTIVGGAWNSVLGGANGQQLILGGIGNTIGKFAPWGLTMDSASDEIANKNYRTTGFSF